MQRNPAVDAGGTASARRPEVEGPGEHPAGCTRGARSRARLRTEAGGIGEQRRQPMLLRVLAARACVLLLGSWRAAASRAAAAARRAAGKDLPIYACQGVRPKVEHGLAD